MKAYVITTGVVFGLILVHLLWIITMDAHAASHPWFFVLIALSGALCGWSWLTLRRMKGAAG